MAKLHPFRAIRPVRDKVHLVATRPVYTYKKSILKAKLEENPYTFIRIINPEYDNPVKTKANSVTRFKHVREKFDNFCASQVLIQDAEAHLYLYCQTIQDHRFVGVIAGASNEEYRTDAIRKHEATLTSRELMFTNYLDTVGFNAEPVLLAYPSNAELKQCYAEIMKARPEYEYSTTDGNKHELWIVDTYEQNLLNELFAQIPNTYIADGHHRSASSVLLEQRWSEEEVKSNPNSQYFLACFMDEDNLRILEFNRLIKSIQHIDTIVFLEKLRASFTIKKLTEAKRPDREHQFVMNLKNFWYELTCKKEIIDESHPVACLDTEILTRYILNPLLGIVDLKTDANIEFISGNLGLEGISLPIQKGKADLGFVLFPTSMEQVKRVADHQMIMPPKSTWVEPKLRSGLTIYNIKE